MVDHRHQGMAEYQALPRAVIEDDQVAVRVALLEEAGQHFLQAARAAIAQIQATALDPEATLYVAGSEALHGFAFALMIGVLTGTYSSIYVAAPILLWLIHPKAMRANE